MNPCAWGKAGNSPLFFIAFLFLQPLGKAQRDLQTSRGNPTTIEGFSARGAA